MAYPMQPYPQYAPSNYQQIPNVPNPQLQMNNNNQGNIITERTMIPFQPSMFAPFVSEDDVYNHPVAPGNTICFRDENRKTIYVKSMGYPPYNDKPLIEKYVREDDIVDEDVEAKDYIEKEDMEPILNQIKELKRELDDFKADKLKNNSNKQGNMKEK